jgi:hypothetical protein
MSLLNPFFLFGSLALAIPVLIHLVRREKSEIVHFSSLMFLLKVPKQALRQRRSESSADGVKTSDSCAPCNGVRASLPDTNANQLRNE